VNPATPRGLVPPRPNLGPEPWVDDASFSSGVIAAGILASLLIAWGIWRIVRRRRGRSVRSVRAPRRQPDHSPRGQVVALSDSVREALIGQFGTAWRAKTTEELSADDKLEGALGREPLQELIRFLDQVDHIKFAPERGSQADLSLERNLAAWRPRVVDLVKKIQAKPNGRSKTAQSETSSMLKRTARMSVR
jgi:hypothetical protein